MSRPPWSHVARAGTSLAKPAPNRSDETRIRDRKNRPPVPANPLTRRAVAVLAALAAGIGAVRAEPVGPSWSAPLLACTEALTLQSLAPVQNLPPAPFAFGLPDQKVYAFYSEDRALVLTLHQKGTEWTGCEIREAAPTRRGWRAHGEAWEQVLRAGFGAPPWSLVSWPLNPGYPFAGALQCLPGKPVLLVAPLLETNGSFRARVFFDPLVERDAHCPPG
ncbi:hypothetical protein [Vannielia litorea]|uniref:Uncharacterized protein n=1 Tax=Vannielia litorea TaxID=1217970 RepID=A0A1N6FTD8_9RHOB|nr:hypothetical protein [Vannielia litorea]SIN98500.1 hypothetical protein SAMN05444002_1940 [Vannielia litorea]